MNWFKRFLLLMVLTPMAHGATEVDYAKSSIMFISKQMGVAVDGKFNKFTAQLNWDGATPVKSTARIDIDMTSADAGSDEANDEIATKSFFDLKTHPKASFVSTAVKPNGGKFDVTGKLTIKGITRDVMASFAVKPQGAATLFEGEFPIRRLQFGIGQGVWSETDVLADEVMVKFKILASAKK